MDNTISSNNLQEECMLDEEVMTKSKAFYLLLLVLGILTIFIGIGAYLTYPFPSKINGTWRNPTIGMSLTTKGNSWTAKIEDYQGVSGYTILYKGLWRAGGVNTYDAKHTKVQVILEKQKISVSEVIKIQKESSIYKIIKDNHNILQIEYTEAGIHKLFNREKVDNYFHFSLEPFTLKKSNQVLFLNHPYFSPERLPFRFSE